MKNKTYFIIAMLVAINIVSLVHSHYYKIMYENEIEISNKLEASNKKLRKDVESLGNKISDLQQENYTLKNKWKDLGIFKITYYCDCEICQEQYIGITAIGNKPKINRTVAVDPGVIKLGSKLKINNKEYIAEDTGGAIKGNVIDVFVATHEEVIKNGVDYMEVKIWKKI